jgi:hypothetical protein
MMILLAWGYTPTRDVTRNPRRTFEGSRIDKMEDLVKGGAVRARASGNCRSGSAGWPKRRPPAGDTMPPVAPTHGRTRGEVRRGRTSQCPPACRAADATNGSAIFALTGRLWRKQVPGGTRASRAPLPQGFSRRSSQGWR